MSLGNTMVQAVGTGLLVAAFPPEERGIATEAQKDRCSRRSSLGPACRRLARSITGVEHAVPPARDPPVLSTIAAFAILPVYNHDADTAANDRFDDYVGASL